MRCFLFTSLALFAWGCVLGHCVGCHDGATSPTMRAETEYTADLLRCVDKAKTLQESRDCRQLVDERWGITEREAGAR